MESRKAARNMVPQEGGPTRTRRYVCGCTRAVSPSAFASGWWGMVRMHCPSRNDFARPMPRRLPGCHRLPRITVAALPAATTLSTRPLPAFAAPAWLNLTVSDQLAHRCRCTASRGWRTVADALPSPSTPGNLASSSRQSSCRPDMGGLAHRCRCSAAPPRQGTFSQFPSCDPRV